MTKSELAHAYLQKASKRRRVLEVLMEEEEPMSQLDALNAMEKRRIIPSFGAWKQLRDLRNSFMRDYPEHAQERAKALTLAVAGAPDLLAVLERTVAYAEHRLGLRLSADGR